MSCTNKTARRRKYFLRQYSVEYHAKRVTFQKIIFKEVMYCNYQSGFIERNVRWAFSFSYLTI